ncbi:metallophosphoesterase [Pseudomonas sp. NA-150]|uniref:metallophosphoesterase n=1 Tax=Pseudomonas sp. NA-150 TaxID=3367525 RepID=UPI0037CA4250
MFETSEVSRIKRFAANTAGKDFAVGDIHGFFTRLQAALDAAGFDPAVDRLFSVGDLIDRGPESEAVIDWLAKPWFHAVQGDHEDMAIRQTQAGRRDTTNYRQNGGAWFLALDWDRQQEIVVVLRDLPIAIEVETAKGLVAIAHADCPAQSWNMLRECLEGRAPGLQYVIEGCQWSRDRIINGNAAGVTDVRAVVVGHTPLREPLVLGNVHHIDTGGWKDDGYFTLLDLATLKPLNPA